MALKRRIIARLNRMALIDNHVYTARHGPARGLKRQGGMGWLPSFLPRMHEWGAEEDFLDRLEWRGLTVYDVGGDQGLFTLFFAHRVGSEGNVVVFEPNPQSLKRIAQNVRLNGFSNVRIVSAGLGERCETLRFTFPESEPARGTAVSTISDQIRRESDAQTLEIQVRTLDSEITGSGLPVPDFIKIDIEGMEYAALKGMRETLQMYRPRLSIEMHGADIEEKTANARRVIGLLQEAEYRMRHFESGADVTVDAAARAAEGHLYCEPR